MNIKDFWRSEDGSSALEYALLAAILGIGLIISLDKVRVSIKALLMAVVTKLAA